MSCTVCNKDALNSCSKCFKIKYCSKVCQKEHWNIHKAECFPLKVESSAKFGRHLVATKNIKQWELILKEEPILSGPSDNPDSESTCLTCFAVLEEPCYKCFSCKWTVCNSVCEKDNSHANFECCVFANQSVPSSAKSVYVQVIRGLLLKERNERKWSELLALQSNVDIKIRNFMAVMDFNYCVQFIRKTCKLDQFTPNEIYHVLGALAVNSFGGEDYEQNKPRSAAHLYNVGSMASHSCTPNSYRLIDKKFRIQMRACIDIPAGTIVTTFYRDTWQPTQERQFGLKMNYNFSCTCERCKDPTELGTFFSGVVCGEILGRHCAGILLPIVPEDEDTEWQCNKCERKSVDKKIREFNNCFQTLIDEVPEEDSVQNFQSLNKIAKSYQNKVHPNHHILVDLEYDMAQRIHNLLSIQAFPLEQQANVLERQLTICNHQLQLADAIRPGFSVFRGKVLHLLQYAMMIKLLNSRPIKLQALKQMKEIESIRKTAHEILSVEPAEKIRVLADSLKNDSEIAACKLALKIRD